MDERKLKTLTAVVEEYIRTGEPVSSKTIAVLPGIAVSSATVRNDMAALEKLGLLQQPHTSAGRVPSCLGYRIYVSKLLPPKALSPDEKKMIDDMFEGHDATAESVVQNALEALVDLTDYTAVSSSNIPKFSVIARIEVIPAGRRVYALLLITSSGDIKNRVCRLEFDLTHEQIEFFTNLLNKDLQGLKIEELNPARLQNLAIALGSYVLSLSPLLYAVYDLSAQLVRETVEVKGESNLLSYSDLKVAEILKFLSSKEQLAHFLSDSYLGASAVEGINVIFGRENDDFVITNSSMVVAKYSVGDSCGKFGLIGPIRLDYSKIIPYVKYFAQKISSILSEFTDWEEASQKELETNLNDSGEKSKGEDTKLEN